MRLLFLLTFSLRVLLACDSSNSLSIHTSDAYHFGYFWEEVRNRNIDKNLEETIGIRKQEIHLQKEHWRQKIHEEEVHHQIKQLLLFGDSLALSKAGMGGTYFLMNAHREVAFVIKPEDENILSLNNPKHFASPFDALEACPRKHIPGYGSTQRDALCYEVAKLLDLEELTPKVWIGIFHSEAFYDIGVGKEDKEKLCSVQEYLKETQSLYDFIKQNDLEKELSLFIDQEEFENANIFVWTIFDNDAHPRNFQVYLKQAYPQMLYGLKKIDNSLSFPEENKNMLNFLSFFPNAKEKLSLKAKQKILGIPVKKIEAEMQHFELSYKAIDAFKTRIHFLKHLISKEDLTIEEINERLLNQ